LCTRRRYSRSDLGFPTAASRRSRCRGRSRQPPRDRRDQIHHENEKREKEKNDHKADYREHCSFRYHVISKGCYRLSVVLKM
jgi:hypothetical protein